MITQAQCGDTDSTTVTANRTLQLFEEDNVDQLTATQRSPEWFNQRQFRITGTSALALWKHFAQLGRLATDPEKELPDTFATICRVLLLKCNNREQHVADKDALLIGSLTEWSCLKSQLQV